MKNFIKEYLNIITYTIIGLIFMIASFYLFINYYHSQELKNNVYISNTDSKYNSYTTKITNIKNNLNKFNSKIEKPEEYKKLHDRLYTCVNILQSEGTLFKIEPDNFYTNKQIYDLGTKFQTDLLNICYATHLTVIEDSKDQNLKNISPLMKINVESLTTEVAFAMDEIKNNGSYHYSTNMTSISIRDSLKSDYNIIADSYNSFADVILTLSQVINQGGNLDD